FCRSLEVGCHEGPSGGPNVAHVLNCPARSVVVILASTLLGPASVGLVRIVRPASRSIFPWKLSNARRKAVSRGDGTNTAVAEGRPSTPGIVSNRTSRSLSWLQLQ